ncbi:MAG: CRTAC1 family protein [Planctomycetota bacterium]
MKRAWLLALGVAACGRPSDEPADGSPPAETERPLFVEVARERGLDFAITSGAAPPTQILEVKGGGIALFDRLGDGDFDLFLPNGATLDAPFAGPGARVFEIEKGLRFTDVTDVRDVDDTPFRRWSMGAAAGDLDGDGLDDLVVCTYGEDAVLLQTPDGRLAARRQHHTAISGATFSSGAALGDLDRDGDLDVYITRYVAFEHDAPPPPTEFLGLEVFGGPAGLPAIDDRLGRNVFQSNADEGQELLPGFEAVGQSGLDSVDARHGLGAVILDLDEDGWLDIYVGNDSMADFALFGLGDMRFEERATKVGLATNGNGSEQATMGIAIADVNRDGAPDLFTTNFVQDTNTLRLSTDTGRWRDGSLASGLGAVSRPFCGWSTGFADFDLDGTDDLLVFNGHVYPDHVAQRLGSSRAQAPLLFRGQGKRFERVSGIPALEQAGCYRGAAFGDLDADGDVDVITTDICGPVRVLQNTTNRPEASVVVTLANTALLGTRVTLVAGERHHSHWLASGLGYQSSSAPQAVFALDADETAVLEIKRPSLPVERIDVAAGARVRID